jgi:hypothetical protein
METNFLITNIPVMTVILLILEAELLKTFVSCVRNRRVVLLLMSLVFVLLIDVVVYEISQTNAELLPKLLQKVPITSFIDVSLFFYILVKYWSKFSKTILLISGVTALVGLLVEILSGVYPNSFAISLTNYILSILGIIELYFLIIQFLININS